RLGMREEARLDQQLVVDELVSLTRLDAPVQDETLPVREGLHDLHELVLRLPRDDSAADGVHMAFDGSGRFEEPLVVLLSGHPRTGTGFWKVGFGVWRNTPRWSSTTEVRAAPSCSTRCSTATCGWSVSPQENTSTAAYRYSGHVWMARCDSAMTTTPLMPNGLNSWKITSTMVACARLAASTMDVFTMSRLLMASGSQSNSSSNMCRPSACTLSLLPRCCLPRNFPGQNFVHCGPIFLALQAKSGPRSGFWAPGRGSGGAVSSVVEQLFACVLRPSRYDEAQFATNARVAVNAAGRKEAREDRMGWTAVTMAAGTAGNAEGGTPLNAFDNALLAAGIGNINLVRISSIVPPGVELLPLPRIKPGAIVPTAFA